MSWLENKLYCDRCEKEIKSKKLKKEKINSKKSICFKCFDEIEELRKNFLKETDRLDFINASDGGET
jgi:hypothetical protein